MRADRATDVLLVEDDPDHADLLRFVVEDAIPGARVRWIDRGDAAAEHLARCGDEGGPPDLVLLDLKLPGLRGHEVLRRARSHPGLAGLPVLVVTSSNTPEDRQAAEDAGADGYIVKVAGLDRMEEVLREAAGRLVRAGA